MAIEAEALSKYGMQDPLKLVIVSPKSLVVTPIHVYANRIREELRGAFKHGSCGMGIGETVKFDIEHCAESLKVEDLSNEQTTRDKIDFLRQELLSEFKDSRIDPASSAMVHYTHILDQSVAKLSDAYSEWAKSVTIMGRLRCVS